MGLLDRRKPFPYIHPKRRYTTHERLQRTLQLEYDLQVGLSRNQKTLLSLYFKFYLHCKNGLIQFMWSVQKFRSVLSENLAEDKNELASLFIKIVVIRYNQFLVTFIRKRLFDLP